MLNMPSCGGIPTRDKVVIVTGMQSFIVSLIRTSCLSLFETRDGFGVASQYLLDVYAPMFLQA